MTTPTPDDSQALALYEPQDFDVVMRDPNLPPLSGIVVNDPPEWMVHLHNKMQSTMEAAYAYALNVGEEHREAYEELKNHYEVMKRNYRLMAQMYEAGMVSHQDQILQFRMQVEQASASFSQQIWGQVAKFAQESDRRQVAVNKLQEIAEFHHQALQAMQKDLNTTKTFQKDVSNWAAEKETQINDLLAREYIDPQHVDERTRRQVDDLRAYTRAALSEFQKQIAQHKTIDVDSVLETIGRRAASRPASSPFISQPASEVMRGPPSKYSSSEARMREDLTTQRLLHEQARHIAENARRQFHTARMGSFMTSASDSLPRQPSGGLGRDPDDSHDREGFNNGPPRGPPRGSHLPDNDGEPNRPPRGTPEERLLHALERLGHKPTSAVVNPIHLNKPTTYDGRDLSKFRSWWMKVESYIDTYADSFQHDKMRIHWVGSLLTDKAQLWHQQRAQQIARMKVVDRWAGYSAALQDRFKDASEKHRNSKKMTELKYQGDTAQYITELLDLNEVVQWSGTTFQNHISKTLPDEITKLVYSRQGAVPESDEDFLAAIQEAGQIYENMLTNPGISQSKGGPTSTPEHSKSGQRPRDKEPRSNPGPNRSSRKEDPKKASPSKGRDPKKQVWNSTKDALVGVDQAAIDQRKKDKVSCWRCGRSNHHTLECFSKKDVDSKDLSAAPGKVSAAKRKTPDSEQPAPSAQKKARIDAILTEPPSRFMEIDDSDSDF